MREPQGVKVEAAGFIADHFPANAQAAGVERHGIVCEPLEILLALWSDSWKPDK